MPSSARPEPLVLLPGTLCDARVFAPVLSRLPAAEVLVPGLSGAGTTVGMAERLLGTLPERFALAGFSLGGIVALEMVARAPGRVTRLALLGTTARPDPPERHAVRRAAVEKARRDGVGSVIEELWPSYVADAGRADSELRSLIRRMAEDAGSDTFGEQSEIAISRADSRLRLADVSVPTLVLCGAEDQLCPPNVHEEIAGTIPNAQLVVVPCSGHFAICEHPAAVAAALATWLEMPALVPGQGLSSAWDQE